MKNRERFPASIIPGQTHIGNIDPVPSQHRSQEADDSGAVLVADEQQVPVDGDFHRLTIESHDAGIVWGPKECSTRRQNLGVSMEQLHVEPFVKSHRFIGTFFLNCQPQSRGYAPDIDVINVHTAGRRKIATKNGPSDRVRLRDFLRLSTKSDVNPVDVGGGQLP